MNRSKPYLILIDDEPDVTDILKAYLEDNFIIKCFNDPIEALESLKTTHYDLMITDISMPNINGMILTKKAREISEKMPIIQCSGQVISELDKSTSISAGAIAILKKPFGSPDDVLSFILKWIPDIFSQEPT
tara:strand:+ start:160 stop:555 length:396 start_codon:yes stop_codon:yes gene_type:complete